MGRGKGRAGYPFMGGRGRGGGLSVYREEREREGGGDISYLVSLFVFVYFAREFQTMFLGRAVTSRKRGADGGGERSHRRICVCLADLLPRGS